VLLAAAVASRTESYTIITHAVSLLRETSRSPIAGGNAITR